MFLELDAISEESIPPHPPVQMCKHKHTYMYGVLWPYRVLLWNKSIVFADTQGKALCQKTRLFLIYGRTVKRKI